MASFDILSEPDMHEVQNAFDQTLREINQRYDFRGTNSEISLKDHSFEITSNSEERVKAVYEVLKDKFVKRKISLKFLSEEDVVAAGNNFRMHITIKKGVSKEHARPIVDLIKSHKNLKVTPSIQGESVRVTGKKKDDLQSVMSIVKEKEFPISLSFGNFRD